jgi:hypothetical protein
MREILFGLGVAAVFGLLPFAVKDMPQWVTWPGLAIGLSLAIWGTIPQGKLASVPAVAFIGAIGLIAFGVSWQSPWLAKPDEKLPGIAVAAVLRIEDVTALRRKYIFAFDTPEKARATFYLNSNDVFILNVIDTRGEPYALEIPLGAEGIPFGRFISLICEEGSGSNYSFLRVSLNGKEVRRRDIPTRIDLDSRQWKAVGLAADEDGNNGGALKINEIGAWPVTFTVNETTQLSKNARDYYKF